MWNNCYAYREYYEKNRIVSDHAKDMLVRNSTDRIDYWLIDAKWASQRNNETHKNGLQLYRENGIPCRMANPGDDYGLAVTREYLAATLDKTSRHPKLFIFDNLKTLRWEIEQYTWATFGKGDNKGQSKDKPNKRNDHAVNALQYALAMKPRGSNRRGSGSTSSTNNSYT